MKKRSVGITVYGALFLFVGVIFVVLWLAANVVSKDGRKPDPEGVAVIVGLAAIVVGIGLLRLHRWARWVTLTGALAALAVSVLAVVSCALALPHVFDIQGKGALRTYLVGGLTIWMVFLIWNGLNLWYFLRPSVKAQFQKQR